MLGPPRHEMHPLHTSFSGPCVSSSSSTRVLSTGSHRRPVQGPLCTQFSIYLLRRSLSSTFSGTPNFYWQLPLGGLSSTLPANLEILHLHPQEFYFLQKPLLSPSCSLLPDGRRLCPSDCLICKLDSRLVPPLTPRCSDTREPISSVRLNPRKSLCCPPSNLPLLCFTHPTSPTQDDVTPSSWYLCSGAVSSRPAFSRLDT